MHVHVVMYVIRRTRLCYLPFKLPFRLFGGNEIIAVLFFFSLFLSVLFLFPLTFTLSLFLSPFLSFLSVPFLLYDTSKNRCCGWADVAHPSTPLGHCTGGFANHEFVYTSCAEYEWQLYPPVYPPLIHISKKSLEHRFLCGPARAATVRAPPRPHLNT